MGIVLDRQPKVSRRAASPGQSATYSPGPSSLMTDSERSGNLSGSAAFCLRQELVQRPRVRHIGEFESVLPGKLDDPVPPFRRANHASQGRKLF